MIGGSWTTGRRVGGGGRDFRVGLTVRVDGELHVFFFAWSGFQSSSRKPMRSRTA
jgi:hypothetical protein